MSHTFDHTQYKDEVEQRWGADAYAAGDQWWRSLGTDGLAVPVGAAEPYPEAAMAVLVLHIHRELIHHLSEVCLLRDLYLHTHGSI